MIQAPPGKEFQLHMGTVLKSLPELAEALDIMSQESFSHHVTSDRNDFANWVNDVLGEAKLAQELRRIKSKRHCAEAVRRRALELSEGPIRGKVHHLLHKHLKTIILVVAVGFVYGIILLASLKKHLP